MHRRGLTPVLGLVLLLGITAIASMGLFVVGVSLADTTQDSAEHQQAERSVAQLAESGNAIAAGESRRSGFAIDGSTEGQVRAVDDIGTLNITVTNRSTNAQILTMERSLGAIIYEASDGTEIAYQGGGVWRRDPSGGSSLVRAPEFHYREEPDPTITFPVVLVRDEFSTSGSTAGELVAHTSERYYPDRPSHYNPLEDGSVLITIDSQYCQGWEQYFEERTDGSAAEGCDAGTPGQLVIQFSVPFELDGLDGGAMIGGGSFDADDYAGVNDSDVSDSSGAPSATPLVESKVEECDQYGTDLNGRTSVNQSGLYCADDGEMTGSNHYTFNTSDGDIEVAIDGDLYDDTDGSNSGIDVIGDGNVTLYVSGSVLEDGASQSMTIGNSSNPSQTRIFVHSDYDVGDKSNPNIYALIYAPNSDVSLESASTTFDGAIVADTVDVHKNMNFSIDSETANLDFYYKLGDAPFYYLHVSETEIHVERD